MKSQIIAEKKNGFFHFSESLSDLEIKLIKEEEKLPERLLIVILDNLKLNNQTIADVCDIYVILDENGEEKRYYCDNSLIEEKNGNLF